MNLMQFGIHTVASGAYLFVAGADETSMSLVLGSLIGIVFDKLYHHHNTGEF